MKAILRWTFAVAAVLAATVGWGVPMLLIVQQKVAKSYNSDFNVPIDSYLSIEMDDDGRVLPVIWSLTDPIFRAAVNERLVPNIPENPSVEQALEAAKALKAEYVLLVKAWRKLGNVESEASLYRNGKLAWSDKKTASVQKEGELDSESSAHSIARSWTFALGQGLFKNYPSKRRDTPPPDPGQKGPEVKVAPMVKVDNKGLAEEVAKLARAGDKTGLLLLLRDAVDAEPFDVERRLLLIEHLMDQGEVDAAGAEAKRAAILIPESSKFHVISARAYLRANDLDRAQAEINEALAREPESFEARTLCGELALLKGEAAKAVEHLNVAASKGQSSELRFNLGLAYGLVGDAGRASDEIEKANASAASPSELAVRYRFAVQCLDAKFNALLADVRNALQKARASLSLGKDPCAKAMPGVAGFEAVVSLLKPPEAHKASNATRRLAASLLFQATGQVEEAIRKLDAGGLAEATLNLGEAAKQYASARKTYAAELEKTN